MDKKNTPDQPHILLFPFMAHGHMIPLMDLAAMLSRQGLAITVVTTPLNVPRAQKINIADHRRIRVIALPFPAKEDYGLPGECETLDAFTDHETATRFILSTRDLEEPFENVVRETSPDCIVSDSFFYWTTKVAHKFKIPRIVFLATCSFSSIFTLLLDMDNPSVSGDNVPFVVATPDNLPDKIELTKSQLPHDLFLNKEYSKRAEMLEMLKEMAKGDEESDGTIVNSFYELESPYVEILKKTMGGRFWTVGPVCLSHVTDDCQNTAERGTKSSVSIEECMAWLNSKNKESVLYVSFGSLTFISEPQMEEIKQGLLESECCFIWVVKEHPDRRVVSSSMEEEIKGTERGLLIKGWAPQMTILSHPSIGGFLTHCGWNSLVEAISFGVPVVTWPLFADQFLNEKLVTQVLRVGLMVKDPGMNSVTIALGEKEVEVVGREMIKRSVRRLMGSVEEGEGLREKARRLGELARTAMEEGGSSRLNLVRFKQFVSDYAAPNP